jgi:hypothetical protein
VRREIDTEQSEVVRQIFEWFAQGFSPKWIAGELNRLKVASPGGTLKRKVRRRDGVWLASAIAGDPRRGTGILNNELYQGVYIWNRSRWVRDRETRRRVSRQRPQSERVVQNLPELPQVLVTPSGATGLCLVENNNVPVIAQFSVNGGTEVITFSTLQTQAAGAASNIIANAVSPTRARRGSSSLRSWATRWYDDPGFHMTLFNDFPVSQPIRTESRGRARRRGAYRPWGVRGPRKLEARHRRLIDDAMDGARLTQEELGRRHGFCECWVSRIIRCPAGLAYYEQRRREIGAQILHDYIHRLDGFVSKRAAPRAKRAVATRSTTRRRSS